jgi:membrane protein
MIDIEVVRTRGLAAGHTLRRLGRFLRHVLNRFEQDGCFAAAGALSYTTLVSLVPLLAISLAVLSAFPIFDKLRTTALDWIFDTFVPTVGGTVDQYITSFVGMAAQTTAVGVVALAVTATMLLATIEDRMNAIWRVRAPRSWIARVTIYWSVLTLGPLLAGFTVSLTSSLRDFGGPYVPDESSLSWLASLAIFLPWVVESFALTLFFSFIPHCPVRWRDATAGAIASATLIELVRWGFSLYLHHFNSYEAIYGALAAIPIFLLWMYLTWGVVLVGAEIAAAVPLWTSGEEFVVITEPDSLAVALGVLEVLSAQTEQGGPVSLRTIARTLRLPPGLVSGSLERLARAGFAVATRDSGYVLARDLATATLYELHVAVETRTTGRSRRLEERLVSVRAAEAEALSVPIASLIDGQSIAASLRESSAR